MFQTIVYHLIGEPHPALSMQEKRMFVSDINFEQHINYFKDKGYSFLSLNEAEERLKNNCIGNDKELLITFDDGYCNTIDVAMPILKRANVSAVMSICGSYIYPETRVNIQMHADKKFADISKIHQWIDNGNSVLAHTYSHFKLTHLSSDECEYEISHDYEILEKALNINLRGIVYPYGSVNEQVISVVRKYYEYGFATDEGYSTSWRNRYQLKRICAESNCSATNLMDKLLKDEIEGKGKSYEDSYVLA